jgi:nitrate reductase gamma subunit
MNRLRKIDLTPANSDTAHALLWGLVRRGTDRGAWSVQQFSNDLLPLILLFAIAITGLFLTASTHLMRGLHYVFLSQLHAVTVDGDRFL